MLKDSQQNSGSHLKCFFLLSVHGVVSGQRGDKLSSPQWLPVHLQQPQLSQHGMHHVHNVSLGEAIRHMGQAVQVHQLGEGPTALQDVVLPQG